MRRGFHTEHRENVIARDSGSLAPGYAHVSLRGRTESSQYAPYKGSTLSFAELVLTAIVVVFSGSYFFAAGVIHIDFDVI